MSVLLPCFLRAYGCGGGGRVILTGIPSSRVCPPSLTLPHAGEGKRLFGGFGVCGQGGSLPPLWGRVGVGGLAFAQNPTGEAYT